MTASEKSVPSPKTALIIPALNEAPVIGRTLAAIPPGLFDLVLVADNGSTDGTPEIVRQAGACVTIQPERGYGATCLCAIDALPESIEVVTFMQADLSENPSEARELMRPIQEGRADLVIGSRVLGRCEHLLRSLLHRSWTVPRDLSGRSRQDRHAGPQLRMDD
jgi:glycosyltransferase involved in cell wall biosynthesis